MRTCPPCSGDCNQGRTCRPTAGNYYAEYAENTYLHLRTPAATAQVKPHIAPEDDEPLTFCAVACWAGAAFFAAVIVAAGLIDWLMSF